MRVAQPIILCVFLFLLTWLSPATYSQNNPLGVFEASGDIGDKVKPGNTTYISQTRQYVISGAGYNIWADHDEFHFAWKKMKGDFVIHCKAAFVGFKGVEEHRKVGCMVRAGLDGRSAHVNAVVHGDGLTSLQFRPASGAETKEIRATITHADVLELERKGNTYIMRVSGNGKPFVTEQISEIKLGEEVYIGLFVGSHNKDVLETGVFSDVRIDR